MNDKKRILVVAQEFSPYIELSEFAEISRQIALNCHKEGYEIRCIMPKFNIINERRHRLHNVVRLSGIYTNVNGADYPMHIKVASLPNARLQVYFLENETLFEKGEIFHDEDGKWLSKNDIRTIFFCKSVLETIKKFGWPPDLIIASHWISSLIPLYINTLYKNEAVFTNAKIAYILSKNNNMQKFGSGFFKKITFDDVPKEKLEIYKPGTHMSLHEGAVKYSDAIIGFENKITPNLLQRMSDHISKKSNIVVDKDNMSYDKVMKLIERLTEIN